MSINDKIKQVLISKQLSPSQLADDIGVQRSSISHILSGRNRPSLDIIQKIVRCYPDLTYEWFLDDDSQMSTHVDTYLTQPPVKASLPVSQPSSLPRSQHRTAASDDRKEPTNKLIVPNQAGQPGKQIDRILIFYSDGTFVEYKPAE